MSAPLLALMRAPAIRRPVDPQGTVVQGEPAETLTYQGEFTKLGKPHTRWRSAGARIELHPGPDGLWMWSAWFQLMWAGAGYKVGEKWGQFAESRDDALFYAAEELIERIERHPGAKGDIYAPRILEWARGLA